MAKKTFLANLDVKKSIGIDRISVHILKLTALHITNIVTEICNISIMGIIHQYIF